jgi:putative protease
MNHRDANQGACTNACRWNYETVEHATDSTGDMIPVHNVAVGQFNPEEETRELLLRDPKQPDEHVPVYEDEHGTYIMNSRDLRAVQHVGELMRMGVRSLKIEGRTKSPYYVARTAQVYRRAIDDAMAGRPFDMQLMDELEALSNRGYTEGFFRRHPPAEYQMYEQGSSLLGSELLVGDVIDANDQWLTIDVKNKFTKGDRLTLMTPAGNHHFSLDALESNKGVAIDVAPGNGHIVRIPRIDGVGELAFAMITRQV